MRFRKKSFAEGQFASRRKIKSKAFFQYCWICRETSGRKVPPSSLVRMERFRNSAGYADPGG